MAYCDLQLVSEENMIVLTQMCSLRVSLNGIMQFSHLYTMIFRLVLYLLKEESSLKSMQMTNPPFIS